MTDEVFEARAICKFFGPVKALNGVSIGVRSGEVHAIIGENGAGKSTLMNVFCGGLLPTSGQLYRHGRPVVFRTPRRRRRASPLHRRRSTPSKN